MGEYGVHALLIAPLHTTSFTCCARDHFVGSRARPLRAEDALRPPACGPALAGSGRRFGHILTCGEDATSQNVKVKPALPAMPMRGQKIEEILCAVELAACYLGED